MDEADPDRLPALKLSSISKAAAAEYMARMGSAFKGEFTAAIAVKDEHGNVHGIIAFTADGEVCQKVQVTTDGSPFIGSLLYGGLVRAAMAMGYNALTF